MDIATWLHGLGLQQREFRDNAIDASVLTERTEADLEKLGVLLGHRKELLSAIEELRTPRPKSTPRSATIFRGINLVPWRRSAKHP